MAAVDTAALFIFTQYYIRMLDLLMVSGRHKGLYISCMPQLNVGQNGQIGG